MKINLKTKTVYTNGGKFIKKLNCNYNITKEDLKDENNDIIGICKHCSKGVYKTENFTDEELMNLVKNKPNICIFNKKNQANVTKIEAGELLYFKNMSGASTIECLDCGYESKSIVFYLRTVSNEPCQCQICGVIYENLNEATCGHIGVINTEPIFCEECYSFNVKVGEFLMG